MAGNPDGRSRLFKDRGDNLPHVAYYADAGHDLIRSMDRGIIFFVAFWSGPALTAFSVFTEFAADLCDSDLTIAIVDVDGASDFYELLQLTPTSQYIAGCGEILWIRDGEIIAKARGHDYIESPRVLRENTSLLASDRRT